MVFVYQMQSWIKLLKNTEHKLMYKLLFDSIIKIMGHNR